MRNELLEQYKISGNKLYGTEKWKRLWMRWVYDRNAKAYKTWTISENNCIIKNFESYEEAKAVFDRLQREHYQKAGK